MQHSHIQQLKRKIILYATIGMLGTSILVGLTSIFPVYYTIKSDHEQFLVQEAKNRAMHLRSVLHRLSNISMQISSRNYARSRLIEYTKGKITLHTMQQQIRPILQDAMFLSDEVLGITRLDETNTPVISIGQHIAQRNWPIPPREVSLPAPGTPVATDNGTVIVFGSPIISHENQRVGTDIIIFSTRELENIINDRSGLQRTGLVIVGTTDHKGFSQFTDLQKWNNPENIAITSKLIDSAMHTRMEKNSSWQESGYIIANKIIPGTNWSLSILQHKDELYSSAYRQLLFTMGFILLLLTAGTILTINLIRSFTGQMIFHSDELEERVRQRTEESVKAMKEAELANKTKSLFLANMSHEIRTPLNGIIGFINILSKTRLTSEQEDYIQTLQISSKDLLNIVNDILDISKIESGQIQIQNQAFKLDDMIDDLMQIESLKAKDKNIELFLQCNNEIPNALVGDAVRIRQVLLNLIDNAIKFTINGTVIININLEKQHADCVWLSFSVKDSGIGIHQEDMTRLFNPFTQLHNSNNTGVGLGLAISKELVSKLGGRLQLSSKPGKGSEFYFSLLLSLDTESPPPDAAELTSPLPIQALPASRILIVDDNEINRRVAVYLLNELHAEVNEAEDGQEALQICMQQKFDIILMDIRMPGISGIEATKLIRKTNNLNQTTPIVALTAHALEDERKSFLAEGMDDYLIKPIDEKHLASMLKQWL